MCLKEREQLAVSPHPPAYFRKLQPVDVLRGGGLGFEGDHHYRSLRASEVMGVRKIANVVEHAAEGRGDTLRGEERVEIQSTGSDGGCSSRPATQDHGGGKAYKKEEPALQQQRPYCMYFAAGLYLQAFHQPPHLVTGARGGSSD